MDQEKIPQRNSVPKEHTWDLSSLYASTKDWQKDFEKLQQLMPRLDEFKGTLGDSAEQLHRFVSFQVSSQKTIESLAVFAMLRYCEDLGSKEGQELYMKGIQLQSEWEARGAFYIPEIQAMSDEYFQQCIDDPLLESFRISLLRVRRFKPYSLEEKGEWMMALSSEAAQTSQNTFGALTDLDFDFGTVDTPEGKLPLSQSSLIHFLEHQDRALRRRAYTQFYELFDTHKNTLSNLLAGDMRYQIFEMRVRNYSSVRFSRLFQDDIDTSVYDALVEKVHKGLPQLHKYYALRAKVLSLKKLAHYDVYVPLVASITQDIPYEEAVDTIHRALKPLGEEYGSVLREGLLGSWVDRYENKGKRSGAFSYGAYKSDPYILMNYRNDSINHTFTLAHEAGHSMHSWYAYQNNPFQTYQYTIFEAEIASTFNEELLADYLLAHSPSKDMTRYLLNKQIDSIIGTFYRQTMFAEFEKNIYHAAEQQTPLTLEFFRDTYAALQKQYFGDGVELGEFASLECLRIPHFYRPFYVYKYATGIACAICLAERVLGGDTRTLEGYTRFLKNGGRKFPLENLAEAGIDVLDAVDAAIKKFAQLVDRLSEEL